MKILKKNFWIVAFIFVMSSFQCSKKINATQTTPGEITATAYAPANPIIRGLPANPFLRVTVNIPAGNGEIKFRKISCTLNASVVSNIQKIDIYSEGVSFSATNLISSVTPSASSFDIPLNLSLQPGTYFIWVSIILKNDASPDNKIDLHCTRLTEDAGKELLIAENNLVHAKPIGVAVRKAGDDGVNTYRIPGLITTDKGSLIAVYDIRYNSSADLPANIDVGMSRSNDSGRTWEPMKVIMDMGLPNDQNGIGDPCILFDPFTKKIWVAALWSKGNHSIAGSIGGLSPDSTGQFVLVNSSDDGATWSAPINITAQVKNPAWKIFFQGPGNGIAMQDGKLVFPAQYWDAANVPYSTLVYSRDHGATWQRAGGAPKSNTTESQLVETAPGTLMINMRDNRGSFRSIATTTNMGTTWTEHSTSYNTLPDPVCMGSFIKANVKVNGAMKDVLFFSNPNTGSGRYNITIKASLDLGQTWLPANQLLIDERSCYGYSCLTKIDDTTIGILYEGTKDLYFVKVPVSDIVK